MTKITSLFLILICLSLTGCFERENPLKSLDSQDVSRWIYKNKTPDIVNCAKHWENQSKAAPQELSECQKTAENLATLLTKAGFGDVIADDVYLPTIWQRFNEQISFDKRNSYDPEAAGKAMQLPPKGSLGEKIEQYKRQKNKN